MWLQYTLVSPSDPSPSLQFFQFLKWNPDSGAGFALSVFLSPHSQCTHLHKHTYAHTSLTYTCTHMYTHTHTHAYTQRTITPMSLPPHSLACWPPIYSIMCRVPDTGTNRLTPCGQGSPRAFPKPLDLERTERDHAEIPRTPGGTICNLSTGGDLQH